MPEIRKAIIVGAGPAGLAAALHLNQNNGKACTIFEIRPEPTTLEGAVGIPANGLRLLHRLGLYDLLLSRGSTDSNFVLHSTQGDDLVELDIASWSKEKTGFSYMRIKRADLVDILLDAVQSRNIPIQFGKRIVAIEEHDRGVTVTFSDGTSNTADLLLGRDGIHSSVRRMHVDPSIIPEYSGYAGVFSILPTFALPATGVRVPGLNATMTREGLFALMKCTASGDSLFWFFSHKVSTPKSDAQDGWEEKGNKEAEGFKSTSLDFLSDVHGQWGSVKRACQAASSCMSTPYSLLKEFGSLTSVVKFYPVYRIPLGGRWSKGPYLLIRDAAHAMQPHASQGVSMALKDVFLLSRLLRDSARPLADVFAQFDQIRRPRVDTIYNTAARNGDVRKRVGLWFLRFKEYAIWAGFLVIKTIGLHKWGIGQKDYIYDIDKELH